MAGGMPVSSMDSGTGGVIASVMSALWRCGCLAAAALQLPACRSLAFAPIASASVLRGCADRLHRVGRCAQQRILIFFLSEDGASLCT